MIGGDNIAYVPCYGAPFVDNLDEGRRVSTLQDYINFAKMAYSIPYFDLTGGMMAEPNDVPVECRSLYLPFPFSTTLEHSLD